MMVVIWILLAVGAGLWFGRRFGPALVAAVIVMAAPLWLVGGFVLDLLRKLPTGLHRAGISLLRALGLLIVLLLAPFIFVWSFLAELVKPSRSASTPMQAATQHTAEVIDLAAFRRRRDAKNENAE